MKKAYSIIKTNHDLSNRLRLSSLTGFGKGRKMDKNIGHALTIIIQSSREWHQLNDAYLNHVIILSDRGHLEQRGGEYRDDQFDRQWHAQSAVDPILQVFAVHQQNGDSDDGHRGGRPVDGVETVEEVEERVRHLHHAVPSSHVHAQQLLQLRCKHDDGHGSGEAADQRLRQHGAQQPKSEHIHEQLHEPGHQSDGGRHLDGRVTTECGVVLGAFGCVRGHHFTSHQAQDRKHAQ